MTSAVLNPFVEAAERDFAYFSVAQLAKSQVRWGVRLVLVLFMGLPFLALAQAVPFIYRRHLALLVPRLPDVTAPADFAFVKDALTLYHASLLAYARFCVFRRQAREVLEEIDEQLDSVEFVSRNKEFLDAAVAQIERR